MQSIEKKTKIEKTEKGIAKEGENKRDGLGLQFSSGNGEKKRDRIINGVVIGVGMLEKKKERV